MKFATAVLFACAGCALAAPRAAESAHPSESHAAAEPSHAADASHAAPEASHAASESAAAPAESGAPAASEAASGAAAPAKGLADAGGPTAGKWGELPLDFFAKHPPLKVYDNPNAYSGASTISPEGDFTDISAQGPAANKPSDPVKYTSYQCVDGQPGKYWAETSNKDGTVTWSEAGIFIELDDGNYFWYWTSSDGFLGTLYGAKDEVTSKCGWGKAA